MVSCINISMSSQIYCPGPVHCGVWWKFLLHSSIPNKKKYQYLEVNVRRAEKLPLFPGYNFLMIGISGAA